MSEYTYEDVIIDPADPRVEIGAEYWFGMNPKDCIGKANSGKLTARLAFMTDENKPFGCHTGSAHSLSFPCLIRKKEPKKRYIPFDLSKPEVRDRLRGKWIKEKGANKAEYCIDFFVLSHTQWTAMGFVANTLLGDYEFLDGTPCGEVVLE